MRQIIFLNEVGATTSTNRSNAVKTTQKTQAYLANKADRLSAKAFNDLVIKAEHEYKNTPLDEIRERIAELMGISDRTPQENAEFVALKKSLNGRNKYKENYKTTQERREYQSQTKKDGSK